MYNSIYLAQKYVRIFVCAHYLLEDTNSFLRVKLLENCELPGKDSVLGQIPHTYFCAK